MNKFRHLSKITFSVFLFFTLLLALSSMGGSPSYRGMKPSLKAISSPDHDGVELSWEPYAGAAAYRVFRAPLTTGPYQFELLAEIPASQTLYTDVPGDKSSVVYRVAVVGAANYVYPLAARLTIRNFAGLVPVSLEFHPNNIDTALASLDWYAHVMDANTGEYLSGSSRLNAGMVLKVVDFQGKTLTLVGTMPSMANFEFNPHQYRLFAVPLSYDRLRLKDLQALGLKGAVSHSFVFSDGNNRQIPEDVIYMPGHVYGMRFDRGTRIDFLHRVLNQDAPVRRVETKEHELLGGSPDDGTLVKVLYDESYETKLYKCWENGKSGNWDGITDNAPGADNVKNAAVVRRGSREAGAQIASLGGTNATGGTRGHYGTSMSRSHLMSSAQVRLANRHPNLLKTSSAPRVS